MHDIFDPSLEEKARTRGITLVKTNRVTSPAKLAGFTMAASVDRAFLKAGIRMLYNLELLDERKDNVHHRNAGLDTTLAKLCAKHNVLIGVNLANLRGLDPKIIGRVQQNIALCRKYHVRMAVFSDARTSDELPHAPDVASLLITLGMTPGQAKETLASLGNAE